MRGLHRADAGCLDNPKLIDAVAGSGYQALDPAAAKRSLDIAPPGSRAFQEKTRTMPPQDIISAIDSSPMNRGLSGKAWLDTPGNIPMEFGPDIVLFDYEGANSYQVHFLLSTETTGAEHVAACKLAFKILFEQHNAALIFGLVPEDMTHAAVHAAAVGGHFAGYQGTPHGRCRLYVLSREMWEQAK